MGHCATDSRNVPRITLGLKVSLTWLLCVLVWLLWSGPTGQAVLASYVSAWGPIGIAAVAGVFLAAVALYCRTLEHCLSLIAPDHRRAEPSSVWLMFLIPYNFVEDFFIVMNVARSLGQEASANPKLHGLRGFGIWSGAGWCTAQLLSLVPGAPGEAAGVAAVVLWAKHWGFIVRVNHLLAE
jgi:hypothetical protein